MPTLDDLSAVQKLVALSANDIIPVSDSSVSSAGTSKIKHIPAALAAQGYTHAWLVNFNNASLKAQASAGTVTLTLMSIPANSAVVDARVVVPTSFATPGATSPALSAATLVVGKTGTTDSYITSVNLLSPAARIVNNTGTTIDLKSEADNLTSATNLLATFTSTGNGFTTLNAGQVLILANIQTVADYVDLIPAT